MGLSFDMIKFQSVDHIKKYLFFTLQDPQLLECKDQLINIEIDLGREVDHQEIKKKLLQPEENDTEVSRPHNQTSPRHFPSRHLQAWSLT